MAEWKRSQYAVMFCQETGRAVIKDLFKARLVTLQARIFAWAKFADFICHQLPGQTRMVMIGLSYRRVGDWRAKHINLYMRAMKQSLGDRLYAFAWVAELQERGAVHYHVILLVKKGSRISKPDAGMWKHGASNIGTARTPYYLATYAGKKYQKDYSKFPKGCHSQATSIRIFRDCPEYQMYRIEAGLPYDIVPDGDDVEQEEQEAKPVWRFGGTAIKYSYAKNVLVRSGFDVKDT